MSTLDLADYEKRATEAVKTFWGSGAVAADKRVETVDAAASAGFGDVSVREMGGFRALVRDIVRRNSLPDSEIVLKPRGTKLLGYFRPAIFWDAVVMQRGRLVAAIQLKGRVGSPLEKNFNDQTEKAVGTAADLWAAYGTEAFGRHPHPFVGWLMLVEDCQESRSSLRRQSPHYAIDPRSEFQAAAYAEWCNAFCRKLVRTGLYTVATVLMSPRNAMNTGKYAELSELTGLKTFVTKLAGHVAAEAARTS